MKKSKMMVFGANRQPPTTPHPWIVVERPETWGIEIAARVNDNDVTVAWIDYQDPTRRNDNRSHEEIMANAYLLGASVEMYQAIRRILDSRHLSPELFREIERVEQKARGYNVHP